MLLPLTVAFILGLIAGFSLSYLPLTILFLLACAAVGLTWFERRQRITMRQGLLFFGSILTGMLYWTGYVWMVTDGALLDAGGRSATRIVGTVTEPVRHGPGRAVIVLAVSQIGMGDTARAVTGHVRVTWREPDSVVRLGDRVALVARMRPPSGLINPGGFDYAAYLKLHGISAVASVSGPEQVTVLQPDAGFFQWSPLRLFETWRNRIREASIRSLQGPALGIYLSMIIGESDYLTPDIRDVFMATGTVHILSISGSHLGLIAFLSFWMTAGVCRFLPAVWLLGLSRYVTSSRLAAFATIFPVIFYTLLAGSQVATVRSLVMILVFLLAVWLGRTNQLLPALAGAAMLILLNDPRAVFDISFQLSFVSVWAIALVVLWRHEDEWDGAPLSSMASRLSAWGRSYLWMAAGVTLATMPLVAYYFNQMAWLGIIANLLVVPFAGFILVPVGLGSAVWLLVVGGDVLPAASIQQTIGDLLVSIADGLARIPGAEWHVASPTVPALLAFYLLLLIAARPAGARAARLGASAAVMILLTWWMWSPRHGSDGQTLRVTFLDVGQGDACVIELPDHRTVLIDGGGAYDTLDMGRAVIGPFLWDQGIRRLDHVIGTHPQLDHIGGLAWIAQKFPVGWYWGNGLSRAESFYQRLRASLDAQGITERIAEESRLIIDSGPCRLRSLNPPAGNDAHPVAVNSRSGTVINNLSVVTRLDCGPHSFLFTADIEADAIAALEKRDSRFAARVIKVPHHGARSSLQAPWIARTHPEAAIISVGRSNPYGHPANAVLAAYEDNGIRLLRTDRDGAVQITAKLSSPAFEITTARESLLQPILIGPTMGKAEILNVRKLSQGWFEF